MFCKRLQRHLAPIFCPDVNLMGQTIFKVIPLSSLVSLKNVKAPRAAAPRSIRGLAGFCTGFVKCVSHFENSSICFHGISDFTVNFPCASVTNFDLGTNGGIFSWVLGFTSTFNCHQWPFMVRSGSGPTTMPMSMSFSFRWSRQLLSLCCSVVLVKLEA